MPLTVSNFPAQDHPTHRIDDARRVSSPARSVASNRKFDAARPLILWHLASLDAPTVAVVWSLAFAWAAGVRLPRWIPALLALGVWSVYVGDRLLDARSARRAGQLHRLRERHYFHWRRRRIFLPLAAAASSTAAWIALHFMPPAARDRDSVLAAASLAYFARVHTGHRLRPFLSPLLTKELLVGAIFTCGCALPTLGILWASPRPLLWPLLCCAAFFVSLAWLNCRAIDCWESPARSTDRSTIVMQAVPIALAALAFAVLVVAAQPRCTALLGAGALSALLLALLDRQQSRLNAVTLRAAADLALLTPALLIPLAWLVR